MGVSRRPYFASFIHQCNSAPAEQHHCPCASPTWAQECCSLPDDVLHGLWQEQNWNLHFHSSTVFTWRDNTINSLLHVISNHYAYVLAHSVKHIFSECAAHWAVALQSCTAARGWCLLPHQGSAGLWRLPGTFSRNLGDNASQSPEIRMGLVMKTAKNMWIQCPETFLGTSNDLVLLHNEVPPSSWPCWTDRKVHRFHTAFDSIEMKASVLCVYLSTCSHNVP